MDNKDLELKKIAEDIYVDCLNELLYEQVGDAKILFGPLVRKLRRVNGALKVVRKRKKKLPLSLRKISKAAARRRARRSAINRKAKQKLISKKAQRTTKKGRRMGLYKNK